MLSRLSREAVQIELHYPDTLRFVQRHGPETLVLLFDVVARAEQRGTELVSEASVREIADRLGVVSKDTVHRWLRQLIRAGVVRRSPDSNSGYALALDDTGITPAATTTDLSR